MALLPLRRVPSILSFVSGFQRSAYLGSTGRLLQDQQVPCSPSNQDEARRVEGNGLAVSIQELLNSLRGYPVEEFDKSLEERCPFPLSDDLVIAVIKRHVADWRPAYTFFEWASRKSEYLPGYAVYNEIIDILGKMKKFDEVECVLKQMSGRQGLFDEGTYGVLLRRYAAEREVKETIYIFCKRRNMSEDQEKRTFAGICAGGSVILISINFLLLGCRQLNYMLNYVHPVQHWICICPTPHYS